MQELSCKSSSTAGSMLCQSKQLLNYYVLGGVGTCAAIDCVEFAWDVSHLLRQQRATDPYYYYHSALGLGKAPPAIMRLEK